MDDVVVITEAGGDVGLGHLTRCMAISDSAKGSLLIHKKGVYLNDAKTHEEPWIDRKQVVLDIFGGNISLLIDSYLAPPELYTWFKRKVAFLGVIDDYNRIKYDADIIINPGLKVPDYRNQVAPVFSGAEYVVLRNEIRMQPPKQGYGKTSNLLFFFGGDDQQNMLKQLLPVAIDKGYEITAIVCDESKQAQLLEFSNRSNL